MCVGRDGVTASIYHKATMFDDPVPADQTILTRIGMSEPAVTAPKETASPFTVVTLSVPAVPTYSARVTEVSSLVSWGVTAAACVYGDARPGWLVENRSEAGMTGGELAPVYTS